MICQGKSQELTSNMCGFVPIKEDVAYGYNSQYEHN